MTEAQFPYAIKLTIDTSEADASIAHVNQLLGGIQAKIDSINLAPLSSAVRGLSEGGQGLAVVSESLTSIAGALTQMSAAGPGVTSVATSLSAISASAGPAGSASMAAFEGIAGAASAAASQVRNLQYAIQDTVGQAGALGGMVAAPPRQPTSAEIVQAAGYTVGGRTGAQVYGTGLAGPITGSAGIEDIAGRLRGLGVRESRAIPGASLGGVEEFWPRIPQPVQEFISGFGTMPPGNVSYGTYNLGSRQIGLPAGGARPSIIAHEVGHAAVDMSTRMAGGLGGGPMAEDLQAVLSSAAGVMRAPLSSLSPTVASYVQRARADYPAGAHVQAEEMVADVFGSALTGAATLPRGQLGALANRLPGGPTERVLSRIEGLDPSDAAMLAAVRPQNAWDMMRYSRTGPDAEVPEGMPYWPETPTGGMPVEPIFGGAGPTIRQGTQGHWSLQRPVGQWGPAYSTQQQAMAGYQRTHGAQPPWAHRFAGVTQARYQEAWTQAGQELGAIKQAFPGMDFGPEAARITSFEPSRRGGPRDVGMVQGTAAQMQRTDQVVASTEAMNDFGQSIMRTAGYFLRWLIVWNVFEFVMNGLRSMVTEATALEEIVQRVAFIQDAPAGQAREYVLDQYGAGAQYGMMPSQTREALPAAAAYGIDVGAGGQMRRAFGIEPSAGIEGLQQALYQTGAQTSEIQDTMAILYREAPNQAGQLLEVISKAGLLSRQLGASWQEIALASVVTSRQMGVAPTEMTTAMARFAMRVPESMSPQIIQELAQMDDPSMIQRMGPSGLGIVTQRGGTQAQVMVEMIRNLNRAMEEGIEPGEAFADLLQSVADTPTEAFAEAKASMATAWTDMIAAMDKSVGVTTGLTGFFQDIALAARLIEKFGIVQYRTREQYETAVYALEGWERGRAPQGAPKWPEAAQPAAPSVIQDYFGAFDEPQPMTQFVTPQWQIDMITDPLKYIGGMRQYGDLSQEEFAGRLGGRAPEFERMLEQIIQMTPGTTEQREKMRTDIEAGFATGGGIFGFQGGEIGALTGEQVAQARWMQSAYPEELRETPFKTLGDVTEAEFMRMLPRAQEWEREAEDIFGREFEEVKMDVAFEDSFKELTISQEALAKTMELLNDTMTGMWNIPAGQTPWVPLTGGIDIVTGEDASSRAVGGQIAALATATGNEISAMGTLTGALMRLTGVMESGTVGAQVGRYTRVGPPSGHPQADGLTSHLPLVSTEGGPPPGHPQARRGTTAAELGAFLDNLNTPGHAGASPYTGRGGYGGRPAEAVPIVVNVTAYLRVDGRQIATQVERLFLQDSRITGRSV